MEFSFDVRSLFPNLITRSVGGKLPGSSVKVANHGNHFETVVDEMGKASANAQGLRAPITSYQRLVASSHILYIMVDHKGQRGYVVGILKLGHKKLFLVDGVGVNHEVEPLCVLDFYVHESRQRSGCGKQLFEEMLKIEGVKPFEVAIDRPSAKFLGFLKKHHQLSSFVKQANNYVVFAQFFSTCKELGRQPHRFSLPSGAKRWTVDKPTPLSQLTTNTSHPTVSTTTLNTSADFSWSPDKTKRTLNSSFSPKESEFNIITGQQRKNCVNFYNNKNSLKAKGQYDSPVPVCAGGDTDLLKLVKVQHQSDSHSASTRAPHLNMRRGRQAQIGTPWSTNGRHVSSMSHVTFGSGHVKYSRHTGGMSVSGSRLTSGKPTNHHSHS